MVRNKWSSEKAIQAFVSDPDYVEKTFKFTLGQEVEKDGDENLCGVCFCEYGDDEWVKIDVCGHGLCTYCFTGYLESKTKDGKEALFTYCPDEKCNMLVPQHIFGYLLDQNQYQRYMKFVCDSFIDMRDDLIWCPGANCDKYFKVKERSPHLQITCDCGAVFCSSCSKDAHYPLDCESNEAW